MNTTETVTPTKHSFEERETELLRELQDSDKGVLITFQKKDGSIREMLCTLNEELIPMDMHIKKSSEPYVRAVKSTCPVFDIVEDGWRSFRWVSIESVTVNEVKIEY